MTNISFPFSAQVEHKNGLLDYPRHACLWTAVIYDNLCAPIARREKVTMAYEPGDELPYDIADWIDSFAIEHQYIYDITDLSST